MHNLSTTFSTLITQISRLNSKHDYQYCRRSRAPMNQQTFTDKRRITMSSIHLWQLLITCLRMSRTSWFTCKQNADYSPQDDTTSRLFRILSLATSKISIFNWSTALKSATITRHQSVSWRHKMAKREMGVPITERHGGFFVIKKTPPLTRLPESVVRV